jgi:hypothetical protein
MPDTAGVAMSKIDQVGPSELAQNEQLEHQKRPL